jgi:small subunit ribosomal protein S10
MVNQAFIWSMFIKNTKGTTLNKVNIKIKAFDSQLVDQTAKKIVELAKSENTKISGPVPLPTKREIYTVLKSVHVNKKSREQFEIKTNKRLVVIYDISEKLMDGLKRMVLPSGVKIDIVIKNSIDKK